MVLPVRVRGNANRSLVLKRCQRLLVDLVNSVKAVNQLSATLDGIIALLNIESGSEFLCQTRAYVA